MPTSKKAIRPTRAVPHETLERKLTVMVPIDLLERALASTNGNITDAVRRGLQLLAAKDSYEKLRSLRGKVKFSVDLATLREDR